MLQEVRKLEEKLKLAPINLEVFGVDAVSRAKSIRYYLLSLKDIANNTNNNNKKENKNG